jgi:hypothetical protein
MLRLSHSFLSLSQHIIAGAVVAGVRRRRHRAGNLKLPKKKTFFDQKNILRHFESESTLKNPKSLTKTTGSEWKVWNFVLFLSFSLLLFLFQFMFDFVWEVVD